MSLQASWRLTPLFAVLLLAGCASSDNLAPQSTLLDTQQLKLAQPKVSSMAISPQWWRSLNDPQLDALMTTTLQNSPSLRQAAARVREAQSILGGAHAAQTPNIDATASRRRERISQNTIPPFLTSYPSAPIYDTSNALGLNFSYELDWWGKFQNQVNAAKAQVDSARAEQAQAALNLTSSVASAYYQLQANLAVQKVLKQEVDNNQRLADLRKAQYQAGIYGVDVPQQIQAQADSAKQQLIESQSQIDQLKHQLAALAGQGPDAMNNLHEVPLPAEDAISPKSELTLDLLGKRPDIAAQRSLVESYLQTVKATKKEFYPSLTISAFAGLNTTDYGGTHPNLLEAASKAWNITPALSLPIFHGGELRSQLAGDSARYDESVESYNQTILTAVQQTADAMTVAQSSAAQLQQASSAVKSIEDVYRVAEARYKAGVIGRDELLTGQSALLQQQQAQLNASSNLLQAKISLLRELGGGYQAPAAEKNQ